MEVTEIISKVKKVHRTRWEHRANALLRCGWILIEVKDGSYILGQIEKFVCPRCQSKIDYHKVDINENGSWHKIDCPKCGELGLPRGVSLDEYFVDKITEDKKDSF